VDVDASGGQAFSIPKSIYRELGCMLRRSRAKEVGVDGTDRFAVGNRVPGCENRLGYQLAAEQLR
jgi:hypothetical protein